MNKRFLLWSASLLALSAASIAGVPACGGSTTESQGEAGHGGFVMDSGEPDTAGQDAATQDGETPEDSGKPDVSTNDVVQVDVEVMEGSLFDLTMPDVTINDAGASLQGCYDCAQENCADKLAACEADDKCRTLMLCFFEDGCVDATQQYGVDLTCALSCAGKAGISNFQDPSAMMGLAVANCMNEACPEDCGIPPDAGQPPTDSGPDDVTVDPYVDVVLPEDDGQAAD
jgi:hypothetical protein